MQEYYDLLSRAQSLPHCLQKVQLLEEAIRLADADGDLERGFESRRVMVNAASEVSPLVLSATSYTRTRQLLEFTLFTVQE